MELPEGMEKGDFSKRPGMKVNIVQIVLCVVEASIFSVLVIYLILSKFNKLGFKETFANNTIIICFVIIVILLTAIITFLGLFITRNAFKNNNFRGGMIPQEEEVEKTTKKED